MEKSNRFEPVDWEDVQRWARLSAGMRIQTQLHAHALALGLMRGRLRRQYPFLSTMEINLKVLEELERLDG